MSKYTVEQVESLARWVAQYALTNQALTAVPDMLREHASLLRERESAKAAVTDEMARKANYIYASYVGGGIESMRAALEAVAPMLASIQPPDMVCEQHPWSEWPHDDCAGPGMPETAQYEALVYLAKLASARVPDETGWLIESTFGASSPSWWTGIPEGCGQSFTTDANKAVRFCRKGDAEAVAKHMRRVIVTEHKWLAAAPKPTNVWPVDAREKAFSLASEMLQKGSAKPETEE